MPRAPRGIIPLLAGLALACGTGITAACGAPEPPPQEGPAEAPEAGSTPETVTFLAPDGLQITADLYAGADPDAPVVLLFHQSASSRGEYRSVGPELARLGYHALAVDLRWGAHRNDVRNETAARNGTDSIMAAVDAGTGTPWPTIDASYGDMTAALAWLDVRGLGGPRYALGSSASAMLVYRLAEEGHVDGVLAYSPGEYDPARPDRVRTWAAASRVPILTVAAPDEEELVGPVAAAVGAPGSRYVVAGEGSHGASILDVGQANLGTLLSFLGHHTGGPPARSVDTLTAPDGVAVMLDRYQGPDSRGVVALFHQGGGSARGEYGFLVAELLGRGFDVLAADLQGGGDRFGPPNRTLAGAPEPAGWSYCDARPQLDAVVAHARTVAAGRPVVLWGSSYSGALVVRAAADGAPVSRVLAFSPASGEPMEGCRPETVATRVAVPLLVVRPSGELEIESVAAQFDVFQSAGHETRVVAGGSHGSSAVNPVRSADVDDDLARILAFLDPVGR